MDDSKAGLDLDPPAHLRDPWVNRVDVTRPDWVRLTDGQFPGFAESAVGQRLASYGDRNGQHCRPGLDRLAANHGKTKKSIQRALDWLAEHGWIRLCNPGMRHRGEANEYALTVPATFLAWHGWWPEELPMWTERPAGEPKRPGVPEGGHGRTPSPRYGEERGELRGISHQRLRAALRNPEGGHFRTEGGHPCPSKVDAGVHPPGSNQGFSHHSELSLRPTLTHGAASDTLTRFEDQLPDDGFDEDPFDDQWAERSDEIAEEVAAIVGAPSLSLYAQSVVDGMAASGKPRPLIRNTAAARERGGSDPWA